MGYLRKASGLNSQAIIDESDWIPFQCVDEYETINMIPADPKKIERCCCVEVETLGVQTVQHVVGVLEDWIGSER
jgi:hypothetical protein